jgi:hypothetical protein
MKVCRFYRPHMHIERLADLGRLCSRAPVALGRSAVVWITGSSKHTGRSLRAGTIRSRQSRRATVSPLLARSRVVRLLR